jgi:hypothetical protein
MLLIPQRRWNEQRAGGVGFGVPGPGSQAVLAERVTTIAKRSGADET